MPAHARSTRMRRWGGTVLISGSLAVASSFAFAPAAMADPAPTPDTVQLIPGEHTVDVPNGVCAVEFTAAGGSGGTAITGLSESGGAGAIITGGMSVSPGESFDVAVGGAGAVFGGFNGGGDGGGGGHSGAGGGGYTEISIDGELLVLAGGGGGSGGGHSTNFGEGGDAGLPDGVGVFPGQDGQDGEDGINHDPDNRPGGGAGGGIDASGVGGTNYQSDPTVFDWDGSDGDGRTGGTGGPDNSPDSGGGGGGGYFGGGGGAGTVGNGAGGAVPDAPVGGGGGGGSSYVADTDTVDYVAADLGSRAHGTNGYATFTWVMCDYDLALTKTSPNEAFEADVPVTYLVEVTNLGPEDMAVGDTVSVADALATGGTLVSATTTASEDFVCDTEFGGTIAGSEIDCWIPVDGSDTGKGLAVGESLTLEYTQVLSGTDPVENTASVTDRGDQSNNTASAILDPAMPSLGLVKSAAPEEITEAGEEVEYSFAVTNTGNITIADLVITEGDFSGTGEMSDIVCEQTVLSPDEATDCTATYVATQADVDAGEIRNTATANGVTPGGNPVASDPSSALVGVDQQPSLGLVKTASTDEVTAAGEDIDYTFAVTNTGNVTMTDIAIVEGEFSGTGELSEIVCSTEPLAPGDTTECSASYVTTAADMKAGSIENTATATGADPSGAPVESDPAAAEVDVVPPLAVTGLDTGASVALGAGALALIVGGAWLVVSRARRVEA
ncbi:DUF7507 domain-containing protein [Microbacterium halotolerans]|uniref:DUF7507 domain-containing protein n=1 Tax=Microbacterium halotolerans TaxID=246613 RepID=UPI0013C32604|nr:DUF11 domain-containing protein [Microbacterium halotolerans]